MKRNQKNLKKNILFIMTDQLRLDYVGFSGEGKMDTPNIDRIAQGTAFTCCQTVNPICQPARTALAAGKYTHQIGTLGMSGDFNRQHPTFMRALQKAGYKTGVIGKLHYLQTWDWETPRGKVLNLHAMNEALKGYGFDFVWEASGKQLMTKSYCNYAKYLEDYGLYERYLDFVESSGPNYDTPDMWPEDYCEPFPFEDKHYPDIVIADKAIDKIKEHSGNDPFFLMVSFLSPHKPFDPPKGYLDQIEYEEVDNFIPGDKEMNREQKRRLYVKRRAYKAMIRMIDEQIGNILDTLEEKGVLNNTVVIFSSDHGEMMGDHFRIQKQCPWKQSVTVPTAIRHPDFLQNAVNTSPVENIDLTATILEIAGLNPQEELSLEWPNFNNIVPCKSLLPILDGRVKKIREYAFSECNGEWQMIRSEKYKFIRYLKRSNPDEFREELYDIVTDKNEVNNLIGDSNYQEKVRWFRRRINYLMDTTPPAQLTWVKL